MLSVLAFTSELWPLYRKQSFHFIHQSAGFEPRTIVHLSVSCSLYIAYYWGTSNTILHMQLYLSFHTLQNFGNSFCSISLDKYLFSPSFTSN